MSSITRTRLNSKFANRSQKDTILPLPRRYELPRAQLLVADASYTDIHHQSLRLARMPRTDPPTNSPSKGAVSHPNTGAHLMVNSLPRKFITSPTT